MDADVWSHIRKGKTAVGYNIELELGVDGCLSAGDKKEAVLGSMTADLMVDDEPECSLSLSKGTGLPFTPQIQAAIRADFLSRVNAFVRDLQAKAEAHKDKVDNAAPSALLPLLQPALSRSGCCAYCCCCCCCSCYACSLLFLKTVKDTH